MTAKAIASTAAKEDYRAALLDAGLLIGVGVPGVYGLGAVFERVVEHFEDYITRQGAHLNPEVMRFPPVISRRHYEQTDHMEMFPNLMGSVHSFTGTRGDHLELSRKCTDGEDWSAGLRPTDVMLTPAACYPLYPTATGVLPADGRTVELRSFVFRHEPSVDPTRMQMFRMHEYVRIGTPQQAEAHRDYWIERGGGMLRALGLDVRTEVANDPFFGGGGRLMAASQIEQTLKFELVVPITSRDAPTALASCNYHLDHFGRTFDITTADGQTAHSACVGFGLERVALALFKTYGFNPAAWPAAVRRALTL